MAEASSPRAQETTAKTAGRGGLAVAGAKVYFILAGLAQQVALKAVLGLEGYGALSSALSASWQKWTVMPFSRASMPWIAAPMIA